MSEVPFVNIRWTLVDGHNEMSEQRAWIHIDRTGKLSGYDACNYINSQLLQFNDTIFDTEPLMSTMRASQWKDYSAELDYHLVGRREWIKQGNTLTVSNRRYGTSITFQALPSTSRK